MGGDLDIEIMGYWNILIVLMAAGGVKATCSFFGGDLDIGIMRYFDSNDSRWWGERQGRFCYLHFMMGRVATEERNCIPIKLFKMPAEKVELWNLNIIICHSFLMACGNVHHLLENPDHNRLAYRVMQAGFITQADVERMTDKIGSYDFEKPLRMRVKDILLIYTIMELNAMLMISDAGDEIKEQIRIAHVEDPTTNVLTVAGYEALLQGCGVFVRSVTADFKNHALFLERRAVLEGLDGWL